MQESIYTHVIVYEIYMFMSIHVYPSFVCKIIFSSLYNKNNNSNVKILKIKILEEFIFVLEKKDLKKCKKIIYKYRNINRLTIFKINNKFKVNY